MMASAGDASAELLNTWKLLMLHDDDAKKNTDFNQSSVEKTMQFVIKESADSQRNYGEACYNAIKSALCKGSRRLQNEGLTLVSPPVLISTLFNADTIDIQFTVIKNKSQQRV